MAHETLVWAWRQPVRPPVKLLLVLLAEHSDAGGRTFPAVSYMAELTGLSESSVKRGLRLLRHVGMVEAESRADARGRSTSNLYTLRLDRGVPIELCAAHLAARRKRARPAPLGPELMRLTVPAPPPELVHGAPPGASEPVDNSGGEGARVTPLGGQGDPPEGARVTPPSYEGVRVTPLDVYDPKDKGDPSGEVSEVCRGAPVDNSGAAAKTVSQEGAGAAALAELAAALRHRWPHFDPEPERDAWRETLAGVERGQLAGAIALTLKRTHPPSAYTFGGYLSAATRQPPPDTSQRPSTAPTTARAEVVAYLARHGRR